jgi:hypothetical protein
MLDQRPVVSLLTTIPTHHKARIISQINAGDIGIVKVLERPPEIRPRVDARLGRVEFLLRLG